MPNKEGKVEPILLLLVAMMAFFTCMLLVCEHFYPNDGQIFQVIAGLLTAASGAFFGRVKPATKDPADPGIQITPSPLGAATATITAPETKETP